ncbi:MAG TPA: hypothetical protein DDX07_04985 [Porphyromonadaceae bacterium]|jgi:hypothetical protein|nr:hypothetical protein [Porphyromonadaceae bacterium]
MTADQFIINRNATIKYISELQEINNYGQDRLGGYNSESVKYRELSKLIKSINEKDATYLGKYQGNRFFKKK